MNTDKYLYDNVKWLLPVLEEHFGKLDDESVSEIYSTLNFDEINYANGRTIEISDRISLANFIADVLDIQFTDSSDPENEAMEVAGEDEYDIESDIESTDELKDNRAFKILWELLKDLPLLTIVTEYYYVDRVYRDSYYTHYSGKHFEYSRYCKRVFIFGGNITSQYACEISSIPTEILQKEFIGCVVLRPLDFGKIGRTLLNPAYFKESEDAYIRYAEYDVSMFGKRLKIKAFPYSMQDEETTSCAEITIINLLDYFSKRYPEYKYLLPSDIIAIAMRNSYDRKLPTKGLDYQLISKVFMEAGFYPVLYNITRMTDSSKFKRILHYYIESGIPIAVGVDVNADLRHSIICVGHGQMAKDRIGAKQYSIQDEYDADHRIWIMDSADTVFQYIVMDDHEKPYSKYEWVDGRIDKFGPYTPENILVPLYKRMFLEASDAYDICTSVLVDHDFGIQRVIPDIGTMDNPFMIRLFMASARGLKKNRIECFSEKNAQVREYYINTPFPRFVWVCELYLKEDYPDKCIGEIIIDATAAPSAKSGSVIILHYPNAILFKLPTENSSLRNRHFLKIEVWEKFDGYRGNLHVAEKI